MAIFTSLEDIYTHYYLNNDSINKYKLIESYILELFNNDVIDSNTNDELKLLWNCNYYQHKIKDYDKMKHYYLMAIDAGNSAAMNNLGYYYQHIEKDYVKMKQYYLMAIDKNNLKAMNNLEKYYSDDKIEFYKELIKIEIKNDLIQNKINELEKLKPIQIYKK